jgi:hypothetical protein
MQNMRVFNRWADIEAALDVIETGSQAGELSCFDALLFEEEFFCFSLSGLGDSIISVVVLFS